MAKNYSGSNREPLKGMKDSPKRAAPLNTQGINYIAQADKGGKEGKMAHKGDMQGNMACVNDDFSVPNEAFSQRGFSKTNEYQERNNAHQVAAAKDIEKQQYKGRYS